MAIEQGLLQFLGAAAAVRALVPNDVAGTPQIYWMLQPKGTKPPYIVLSRITTNDVYTYAGSAGIREGLFQVDCYTDSKAGTSTGYYNDRKVAAAVRGVLDSFQGNLPDTDSTAVQSILTDKDFDMPYEEGATGFLFQTVQIFRVWYSEEALTISEFVQGGNF